MKKIIILNIAALLFAGAAFADVDYYAFGTAARAVEFGKNKSGVGIAGTGGIVVTKQDALLSGRIGTLSTNVGLAYNIDATSGNGYCILTQHSQATRAFGTSFDSTRVYTQVVAVKGAPVVAPTTFNSKEFDDAKWKSM